MAGLVPDASMTLPLQYAAQTKVDLRTHRETVDFTFLAKPHQIRYILRFGA
jgi:hypothetical protein